MFKASSYRSRTPISENVIIKLYLLEVDHSLQNRSITNSSVVHRDIFNRCLPRNRDDYSRNAHWNLLGPLLCILYKQQLIRASPVRLVCQEWRTPWFSMLGHSFNLHTVTHYWAWINKNHYTRFIVTVEKIHTLEKVSQSWVNEIIT